MPIDNIPGRALATRRAAADIVRAAALGSYGVTGFEAGFVERLHATLVGRMPGIRISFVGDDLTVALKLRVTAGLPVAEVARQVDSAVRYGIRRALGREVDELRIRIGGLQSSPGTSPPVHPQERDLSSSDLADSGTDVA
ncbi:MAG: Asp23/Gls24 family envelope stress response protein [Chloroflexi bacterium]|nr:Asp23/Gls24 family envelope stress response protein [Chloroflexota bacterium]